MSQGTKPSCDGCGPLSRELTHITTVAQLKDYLKGVPGCTPVVHWFPGGGYEVTREGVGVFVGELLVVADDKHRAVCLRIDL